MEITPDFTGPSGISRYLPIQQKVLLTQVKKDTLNYFIDLLTVLGNFYSTGIGFNFFRKVKNNGRVIKNDWKNQVLDIVTNEFFSGIMAEDQKSIMEKSYKYGFKIVPGGLTIKYDNIIKLSQIPINFNTVIIKIYEDEDGSDVETDFPEWWNEPLENFPSGIPMLPYLSTRKYIEVTEPYMEVSISREVKRSLITLDDILFATRALSFDQERMYDEFILISVDDDVLYLEVKIDNYWNSGLRYE